MTATYHKRFYPNDVDGSVVYVAPNDVNNNEDSAYDKFLNNVGTDHTCRDHLRSLQREFLKRRPAMLTRIKAAADAAGQTFNQMKSVDIAFENGVMDFEWVFWQYSLESTCAWTAGSSSSPTPSPTRRSSWATSTGRHPRPGRGARATASAPTRTAICTSRGARTT